MNDPARPCPTMPSSSSGEQAAAATDQAFAGRVLYMARAPFISGAERALLSMLRHLDRARVEPRLILGHETDMLRLAGELDVPVQVMPLPRRELRGAWAWWRSCRRLGRCLDQFRPHVVHANDVPSCQAMSVTAGSRRIPRVLHVRWVITAGEAAWWARAGMESVLCISRWMQNELGSTRGTCLSDAVVEVLPDAVDWPALTQEPPAPPPRPQRAFTLGFAGQLIPVKGLDLVIEALARLPAQHRPQLRVAGADTQGGRHAGELHALAQARGVARHIQWLGFVSDMGRFYADVDVMVCPSRLEPLGLVPLEAARFGVPTIANRVGGLAETIDDPQTGWLVEPTIEAWAAVLPQLQDMEQIRRRGLAAHQRTRDLYSPRLYQQRLMAIYQRLDQARRSSTLAAPDQAFMLTRRTL